MANRIERLVLACVVAALGVQLAHADPVPDAERGPVDIRRTTLIVRDIDRSLAFYRDALGLKVIYDQMIRGNERTSRLVLLRANDTFVGNLGLMQRIVPAPVPKPVDYHRAAVGETILVINVKDLERRLPRAKAVPGVKIADDTARIDYPAADGKGKIPVNVTTMWDPDGYFVELNQILGQPAGTQ